MTPHELRARREQLGISKTRMAEELGWPQGNLTRFESGRHDPKLSTITRYQAALNKLEQDEG